MCPGAAYFVFFFCSPRNGETDFTKTSVILERVVLAHLVHKEPGGEDNSCTAAMKKREEKGHRRERGKKNQNGVANQNPFYHRYSFRCLSFVLRSLTPRAAPSQPPDDVAKIDQ